MTVPTFRAKEALELLGGWKWVVAVAALAFLLGSCFTGCSCVAWGRIVG